MPKESHHHSQRFLPVDSYRKHIGNNDAKKGRKIAVSVKDTSLKRKQIKQNAKVWLSTEKIFAMIAVITLMLGIFYFLMKPRTAITPLELDNAEYNVQ
mmetsp:Transcript_2040/g.2677  ORF Transcript_2040/g.2677 Transcript_2040/m.2677 type:complete len:98 (-) Transcript_2040:129-422(-)